MDSTPTSDAFAPKALWQLRAGQYSESSTMSLHFRLDAVAGDARGTGAL